MSTGRAESNDTPGESRCGLVAIVGRPNVGKSTYINAAIGEKLSITSRKPQTTRYRLLAVKTTERAQIVFVDTPGFQSKPRGKLNDSMNKELQRALDGVNVVLLFIEALQWTAEDEGICRRVANAGAPVILVVNKVDRVSRKESLLPFLAMLASQAAFDEIVPLSGERGTNLDRLETCIVDRLPVGPALFPADQLTDRSMRFLASEVLREKLMRKLGDELPYSVSVITDRFEEQDGLIKIAATVWVERSPQKAIVIGEGGSRLKSIASLARRDLEKMFDKPVYLETWVKVKERWTNDAQALQHLGFDP